MARASTSKAAHQLLLAHIQQNALRRAISGEKIDPHEYFASVGSLQTLGYVPLNLQTSAPSCKRHAAKKGEKS